MKRQVVFTAPNGIRVVIDDNSDPRNVQLFAGVKIAETDTKRGDGKVEKWIKS